MRMAEFAEAHLPAAMDADADAELVAVLSEVALHLAGGPHGGVGMVGTADRKVEDRHHGIADGLVEKPVVTPDGMGTSVIELVEEARDLGRRLRLRQLGIRAAGRRCRTLASMVTVRAFMVRSNINSQIVHRLGFMRLGRMPTARNGTDSTPRSGIRHMLLLPAALCRIVE